MNENIIHEDLVQKNIDLLNLYKDEEKEKLENALSNLGDCLSNYKTDNSGALVSKISNIKSNASVIISNRDEYCKVLSEAIRIYHDTALGVVSSANNQGVINNE